MTDAREEYQQSQERLSELYNQINELQAQISDIDKQQSSFIVGAWQLLGYNEAENLETVKRGLERKIFLLSKQAGKIQARIQVLIPEVRQKDLQQIRDELEQQKIIEEKNYLSDPDKFLNEVLITNNVVSQVPTEQIYAHARRIIAASAVINTQPNTYRMIQALKIVTEARDRAFAEYKYASQKTDLNITEQKFFVADEFEKSAKTCFFNMVDKLNDVGCQSLKLLYLTDPERAEWYFGQHGIDTDPKMLEKLQKEIDDKQHKLALMRLMEVNGFNGLPNNVKQQLIEQYVYVNKLDFDLLLVKDDQKLDSLQNYSKILHANIKNSILNNKSQEQIAKESEEIKQKINQEANDIRRRVFKQQLTESAYIPIGAGFGAAWIFGLGFPTAVALSTIAAVSKATVETSDARLQMPTIDEAKKIVEKHGAENYIFLEQADRAWHKDSPVPVEKPVIIKTIKDDIVDYVSNIKTTSKQKILLTIFGVVAAGALGAALPLVLPVAVAGAITYFASQIWSTAKNYSIFIGVAIAVLGIVSATTPAAVPFAVAIAAGLFIGIAAKVLYRFPSVKKYVDRVPEYFSFRRSAADMSNYLKKTAKINPNESLHELNKAAPDLDQNFSNLLAMHFNKRLEDLTTQLKFAKENSNKQVIKKISKDILKLEKDWSQIKNYAKSFNKDPALFYSSIEKYLEESYKSAKENYLNFSRSTQKPLTFADKPNFNMDFKVDYVAKQQEIKDLIELKNKVNQLKREYR